MASCPALASGYPQLKVGRAEHMLSTLLQNSKESLAPMLPNFHFNQFFVHDYKDRNQDDDADFDDVISLNRAFNGFWELP